MTLVQHNIYQLQFDLQVDNEKRALKIQNEVSTLARNELPGILDEIFNSLDRKEYVQIIEKLEIDLGVIQAGSFISEFKRKLRSLLTEELGSIRWENETLPKGIKFHDAEPGVFEIFKHYLLNGNLPWYFENQDIDLELEFEALIEKGDREFHDFIKTEIGKEQLRKRLIYSFPSQLILQLVQKITLKEFPELELIYTHIPGLIKAVSPFQKKLSSQEIEFLNLNALLVSISKQQQISKVSLKEIYLQEIANAFFTSMDEFQQSFRLILEKVDKQVGIKSAPELGIDAEMMFILKEMEMAISKVKQTPSLEESRSLSVNKDELSSIEIIEKEEEKKSGQAEMENYFILNGGMILLHPFLPTLFKKLKLLEDNKFINENARHKAIHLLQYAVFGNSGKLEYQMVLNKLLCGYPIDEPVPLRVSLTAYEKAETTRMIKAAILHWSALKKTSVAVFKASFLQRKALLKIKEGNWILTIENKAIDVLKDTLPWGYSLIKLPWMEKFLRVEW